MIADNTPYSLSGNLGGAYNECMNLLNPEDWGIIRDRDTIYTTPNYMELIDFHIQKGEARAFTGMCNRVNYPYQKDAQAPQSNDHLDHVNYGLQKQKDEFSDFVDITNQGTMSGFWMCIKKSLWDEIGGVKEKMMTGIDNDIHRRIRKNGDKIYLLQGLYLYHFYSNYNGVGVRDISHLKK